MTQPYVGMLCLYVENVEMEDARIEPCPAIVVAIDKTGLLNVSVFHRNGALAFYPALQFIQDGEEPPESPTRYLVGIPELQPDPPA